MKVDRRQLVRLYYEVRCVVMLVLLIWSAEKSALGPEAARPLVASSCRKLPSCEVAQTGVNTALDSEEPRSGVVFVMPLEEAINARYPPRNDVARTVRDRLIALCRDMIDRKLVDQNAEQRLCSNDHADFWQQLSEVLLADKLFRADIAVQHAADGPDFLCEVDGRRIWIEVITPEPSSVPDAWINHVVGNVVSFPHQELLLRWTSAIKDKAEKLLGRIDRNTGVRVPGYLQRGIVGAADAYVIAINSRLLRGFGGAFPELIGISQFPFAVEATLAVGPIQVVINRETSEAGPPIHQRRVHILKANGAEVPANTFLDPAFSSISAIWAVDIDELIVIGEPRPMVVVHNPLAANRIPTKWLPAQAEYEAHDRGDYFELTKSDLNADDKHGC